MQLSRHLRRCAVRAEGLQKQEDKKEEEKEEKRNLVDEVYIEEFEEEVDEDDPFVNMVREAYEVEGVEEPDDVVEYLLSRKSPKERIEERIIPKVETKKEFDPLMGFEVPEAPSDPYNWEPNKTQKGYKSGFQRDIEEQMPYAYTIDDQWYEASNLQVPNPELGPLEKRVSSTWEEALFDGEVSMEDAQYWFTEPDGGWNFSKTMLKKAPQVPNKIPTAEHFGDGRTKLADVEAGFTVTGKVTRLMLYHGIQVDIGAEYDGVVPVPEELWAEKEWKGQFWIDDEVEVRVFKVRDAEYFRWPIQLELVDHWLNESLPPPEEHRPAMDLRGKTDFKKTLAISERPFVADKFWADYVDDPMDAVKGDKYDYRYDEEEEAEWSPLVKAAMAQYREVIATGEWPEPGTEEAARLDFWGDAFEGPSKDPLLHKPYGM